MNSSNIFDVCVLPGDGIGIEVTEVASSVLQAAVDHVGHFQINAVQHAAGAALYQQIGTAMPEEAWRAAEEADAIYLGAMGLPDISKRFQYRKFFS